MCFTLKWDIFWGNKSCILLLGPGCAKCSYPRLVVCVECFLLFFVESCLLNWFYLSWCLWGLCTGLPCSRRRYRMWTAFCQRNLWLNKCWREPEDKRRPNERKGHDWAAATYLAVIHAGLCWDKPVVTRDHRSAIHRVSSSYFSLFFGVIPIFSYLFKKTYYFSYFLVHGVQRMKIFLPVSKKT